MIKTMYTILFPTKALFALPAQQAIIHEYLYMIMFFFPKAMGKLVNLAGKAISFPTINFNNNNKIVLNMALKFSPAETLNLQDPDQPAKYYPRSQVRDEIGLLQLSQEIAWSTTLTEGEVYNVLMALINKVKDHLYAGDSVSLGEFGKLFYKVSGERSHFPAGT
ncbi:MAG: HU family DNA-binding protein [Candidatus Azobacteroides sp.]|nr:HU family DNA-binding protein [Candidatus Azobacteroides sp.]